MAKTKLTQESASDVEAIDLSGVANFRVGLVGELNKAIIDFCKKRKTPTGGKYTKNAFMADAAKEKLRRAGIKVNV